MKFRTILWVLVVLSFMASGQNKSAPPAIQKKKPGIDPVVIFDYLSAGKPKQYSWNTGTVKCGISSSSSTVNHVNVLFNGKLVLSNYTVTKIGKSNGQPLKLKLAKNNNYLVVKAENSGSEEPFPITISLTDSTTGYNIAAICSKTSSDSIIIKQK